MAQRHDVVALRIKNKYDDELPVIGTVPFVDVESEKSMIIPTFSQKLKKEWKAQSESNQKKWQSVCLKHGIFPVVMNTTDSPLKVLNSVFSETRGVER